MHARKQKNPQNIRELNNAIEKIRRELKQIKEVKALLREEGILPDESDKAKESKLIKRLLRFEKDLQLLEGRNPKGVADKRRRKA